MKALGMIETYGFIGSVEAADVMLKCSDVTLLGTEKVSGGLYYISITGDVGAVKTAVDAGAEAVRRLGENCLQGAHVIPRPDDQLAGLHHPVVASLSIAEEEPASQAEAVSEGPILEEQTKLLPETEEPSVPTSDNSAETGMTFKEYKRKLDRTRASELRELVSVNPHLEIAEDTLTSLVRREMIALLLEDFKAQHKQKQ
ncbi:BMC domain-containing protein [Streptococcus sp. 20-1249]|uniref:BMC domain-containing protein n=1 Tax=Streptococcus hepaticus TaxID=3349163 RepID=UPI0037482346